MVIVKTWETGMYEQNSVEFMGVLVDRQYTTGQKYAQLVFETAEGIRLSLSRNINMVRSLRLGLTYKVKGLERTVGQKRYIHEPIATLVTANKLSLISKRYKILIPITACLIVVLGGVGALTYAAHSTSTNSPAAVHTEKPASKSVPMATVTTPADSQPVSDAAPSAPVQQQAKITPVRSPKNSTPDVPATTTTNPVTSDAAIITPVMDDASNPSSAENGAATVADPPAEKTPEDAPDPLPPVE